MNYFGNLDIGFIAKSDFIIKNKKGKVWDIPQNLYSPIKQDAILLKMERKIKGKNIFKIFIFRKSKDKLISLGILLIKFSQIINFLNYRSSFSPQDIVPLKFPNSSIMNTVAVWLKYNCHLKF